MYRTPVQPSHFVRRHLHVNMDSSDDDLFLTQSSFRSGKSDSEDALDNLLKESFDADAPYNAPYGVQFSDISDAEEILSSCQVAENQYSNERFGIPVPEADVASKSRKR